MYKVDRVRQGGDGDWYGVLAKWGPLDKDSSAKLKRSQLNMTNFLMGVLFSPRGWNLCWIGRKFPSAVVNNEVSSKRFGLADSDCLQFHSQLAAGGGGVGHLLPIPLHYLAQVSRAGSGNAFPALPLVGMRVYNCVGVRVGLVSSVCSLQTSSDSTVTSHLSTKTTFSACFFDSLWSMQSSQRQSEIKKITWSKKYGWSKKKKEGGDKTKTRGEVKMT